MKEKDIQKKIEGYLRSHGLKFFHIPDGVLGFLAQKANPQVKSLISRWIKGVPDLMIWEKDPKGGYNYSLLLELKTEKGKLSQGQKNWHKGVNVHVTYGYEEAEKVIDDFLAFIDSKWEEK